MTLFEYIAVANAIILSFAVIRVLDGLPHAFDPSRRFWVHSVFLVSNPWAVATFWWAAWSYRDVTGWTYPKFLLMLAAPVLLYSMATTLVSGDPRNITSWRDHFRGVYRRFFALMAVYALVLALTSWMTLGMPLTHPVRLLQLIVFFAAVGGAFWSNSRYHGAVAVLYVLLLAGATIRYFAQPAPLAVTP